MSKYTQEVSEVMTPIDNSIAGLYIPGKILIKDIETLEDRLGALKDNIKLNEQATEDGLGSLKDNIKLNEQATMRAFKSVSEDIEIIIKDTNRTFVEFGDWVKKLDNRQTLKIRKLKLHILSLEIFEYFWVLFLSLIVIKNYIPCSLFVAIYTYFSFSSMKSLWFSYED